MYFAKAFGVFFLVSFGGGTLIYSLLALIAEKLFGAPMVFGSLFRMFAYHEEHSFQYIALIAITYSFFASIWATFRSYSSGWRR